MENGLILLLALLVLFLLFFLFGVFKNIYRGIKEGIITNIPLLLGIIIGIGISYIDVVVGLIFIISSGFINYSSFWKNKAKRFTDDQSRKIKIKL